MRYRYIYVIILIIFSIQPTLGIFEPGEVEPTKYHQFVITNVSPIDFYPSDIKTINITIQNVFGYSAFGVSTVIDPNKAEPMKFTNELQKYIGNEIGPSQTITVQYEIYIKDTVPKGTYYIPLTILWSTVKDGTVKRQEDLFIGIKIAENPESNKIEVFDIILPEKIFAGDNFKIKVLLRNLGKDKLNIVKVSIPIQLPFATKDSNTERYISLDPNQSEKVEFDFYVDKQAISRVYNFNLTLEYKDALNRWVNQQSNFGVLVDDKTQVYIQDIIIDPQILEPGDDGLLTMQVANAGTNEIRNIRFSINGGDGILTQSENFIGQIGPKKSSSISFGIHVNPKLKIGDYGLNVQLSYDDANGNNHQYSYLYPLSIVSFPLLPISSGTFSVLFIGFLFMVFSYIVFFIKARRIENQMNE